MSCRFVIQWGIVLLLVAGGAGAQQAGVPEPPQIVAQGTADVRVPSDRATIRFGVQFQAADARAAQGRVNEQMQRVIQAVRRLEIPQERIRTERLELFPVYEAPMPGREYNPRLVGFRAANLVSVELENPARLGPVIDAAVGAGANSVEGIEFSVANEAPHRAHALQQASQEAQGKAKAIAAALGVTLNRLLEAREGGVDVTPPRPLLFARAAMADTPVQPGEVIVHASVTVRYSIGQ